MAQGRNNDNVSVWEDAHVYVSDTKVLPASAESPVGPTWDEVGILDGKAGIDDQRKWTETKEYGWGTGLAAILRSEYEHTGTFDALEDNPVVDSLYEPGSTASDVVVARPAKKYVLLETIDQNGRVKRRITRKKAEIWAPGAKKTENAVAKKSFTMNYFADGLKRIFHKQESTASILNAVQTVTLPAGTTGGTFTLTYQGVATTALSNTATAAAVRSALQALAGIGAGNVDVTGSAGGPYTITFIGDLAGDPVSLLTASGASLTPPGTVVVAKVGEEA
ncbi:hypothetical protein [Rhodococcoides fascians]|uniref:hypothetical protein n=1 Tax=Rhodococcoides fascians TaxID=1828 RepID=UPI000B098674|nr:hypothetical protein [Rhodococcus fascians]